MEVVLSDGTRLFVREIPGRGAPVVLSHSLASSADDLEPLAEELSSRGHRVVWFDQRGHGASGHAGEVSIDRLAQDVVEVIDDRGVRGAVAIGHSSGGYALLALASQASTYVSRVVAAGTTAQLTSASERISLLYARSSLMARVQRRKPIGRLIVRRGAFGRLADEGAVDRVWKSATQCPVPTRTAYVNAMLSRPSLMAEAVQIDVPLIVVRGSRDRVVARRQSEQLAGVAKMGTHVEVPNAGHMVPIEDPFAVAEAAVG